MDPWGVLIPPERSATRRAHIVVLLRQGKPFFGMSAGALTCTFRLRLQEELAAGCGGQRHRVDELCAESSAGGHEDWGILARELRPSAHSPSLIRLSWCLLAPHINSLPIATLLSVLHVCRDRFEAFGGFRVTDWAAPSG